MTVIGMSTYAALSCESDKAAIRRERLAERIEIDV